MSIIGAIGFMWITYKVGYVKPEWAMLTYFAYITGGLLLIGSIAEWLERE